MDNIPYLTIIYTRFAGPTNTQGSRIVATSTYFGRKSKTTVNYDHALSGGENHLAAARKYLGHCVRGAEWELIGVGDNPTGSGSAWVFKRKEG